MTDNTLDQKMEEIRTKFIAGEELPTAEPQEQLPEVTKPENIEVADETDAQNAAPDTVQDTEPVEPTADGSEPSESVDVLKKYGIKPHIGHDGKEYPIDLKKPIGSASKAVKEMWDQLPEQARAEFYKREGDFHTKLQEQSEAANFGTTLYKELAPYETSLFRRHNIAAPELIKAATRSIDILLNGTDEQRIGELLNIGKSYNVNFSLLNQYINYIAQQNKTGQAPTNFNPADRARLNEQKALQERLDRLERTQTEKEFNASYETAVNGQVGMFMKSLSDSEQKALALVIEDFKDEIATDSWIEGLTDPAALLAQSEEFQRRLRTKMERVIWANEKSRKLLQGGTGSNTSNLKSKQVAADMRITPSTQPPGKTKTKLETLASKGKMDDLMEEVKRQYMNGELGN